MKYNDWFSRQLFPESFFTINIVPGVVCGGGSGGAESRARRGPRDVCL